MAHVRRRILGCGKNKFIRTLRLRFAKADKGGGEGGGGGGDGGGGGVAWGPTFGGIILKS